MPKKANKKKEKYITERISKAGNHSFEICIRAYGQTFRKSVNISEFESRNEAMDYAKLLRDKTIISMSEGYSVSRFSTVRELYEESLKLFPVSVKTREKYEFIFNGVMKKYGMISIDKITSADIQITLNEYAEKHTKVDTSRLLTIWRKIYKCCAMKNINVIDRTVAVSIPKCARPKSRKKDISTADLEIFCEALLDYNKASIQGAYRGRAIYYAIQIMLYCGTRPAETFALMRSDIDLINNTISINKAVCSSRTERKTIGATKTEKSVRLVPISSKLKPILIECMQWSKHEILFADYYGNLMEIDDIDGLIRRVSKKVKIKFNLYTLRHQFSTDLHNAGVPQNIIRDLMGHESASMSLDYATSKPKDREQAINDRKFA